MGITVREVCALKEFQAFRLVAGASGLSNVIEKIGILDYEFALQDEQKPRKWGFRKYDFVLTSLLFAKGHPELLLPTIRELCGYQVSALAVKDVCYDHLPEDVLAYADEHALPIFMFGRDDAYFEDIVVSLNSLISERKSLDWMEHRIALYLNGELDVKGERELNRDILTKRTEKYRIYFCKVRNEDGMIRDYRKCYQLGANVIYYKEGCFVIRYGPDPGDKEKRPETTKKYLSNMLCLPADRYRIGVGALHEDPEELPYAMKECLYAMMHAQLFDMPIRFFENMGIYRILFPHYTDAWFEGYTKHMMDRIMQSDRETDSQLYATLECYVRKRGNIQDVADEMHMHKNTVRYRINKVREQLDMENDPYFDLQITVAFMIDELHRRF